MLNKQFIENLDLHGKRVLIRVDFNTPLNDKLEITDNRRIQGALNTINYVIGHGGKAILMSHVGRPKGKRVHTMSLNSAAHELSQLLGKPVYLAPDCVGEGVEKLVNALAPGDVILLENLRFHAEETENDPAFCQSLARLADVYINDAFGTAHRAHASTTGVAEYVSTTAVGYLIKKELDYLGSAIAEPKAPFAAILGGAKVSDKIKVIENLFEKVQCLIIGGGMACTFLKAQGHEIGSSLLESDYVELAKRLCEQASQKGVQLLLPVDYVIAEELQAGTPTQVINASQAVPENWKILDIGPKSIALFSEALASMKTICWNGPMGVFEISDFAKGTFGIAEAVAHATDQGAVSIIGGGDSAAAIQQANLESRISHISTGGGASLEFLEGKELPGIAAIQPSVP